MKHLDILSAENSQVVDNLFGREYVEASLYDQVPPDRFLEANEQLAGLLYGSEVTDLLRRKEISTLNTRRSEIIEAVSVPESAIRAIDFDMVGMVVVRPEALDLVDSIVDFLNSHELDIVLNKATQISFNQYWSLYGPGLVDVNAEYDFPTRTLNYVDKELQALVVKGRDGINLPYTVSEYITKELKGRQGSYCVDTLRGDLAYTAFKALLSVDGTSFANPSHNLALDPIGAYRHLVRGTVTSDRAHETADSPLIFYAGQALHVPDRSEIRRDIRVLLTEDDIDQLAEIVCKTGGEL